MEIALTDSTLRDAGRFAIALANTDDPMSVPPDRLADPVAARLFLAPHLPAGEDAAAVAVALLPLRDRLRRAILAATGSAETAGAHDIAAPLLALDWRIVSRATGLFLAPDPDQPAASRLAAYAALGFLALLDAAPERIRQCQSAPCDSVFVDETKPGRQRFCCKRCATRYNVASHRARRRV